MQQNYNDYQQAYQQPQNDQQQQYLPQYQQQLGEYQQQPSSEIQNYQQGNYQQNPQSQQGYQQQPQSQQGNNQQQYPNSQQGGQHEQDQRSEGRRHIQNIAPSYQDYYQNQQQTPNRLGSGQSKNLQMVGSSLVYPQRNIDMKTLLQNPDPSTSLFNPEEQRFQKDFASYEKYRREQENRKKEMITEKHRIEALERQNINLINNSFRESKRWEQVENQTVLEKQKREYQSQVLLAGKRNTNGLPFNPLTLQYDNSDAGLRLKARDDDAKVRGFVRAQNLDTRANTGYNILNGQNRMQVDSIVPGEMNGQYKDRIRMKDEFYSLKYKPEGY